MTKAQLPDLILAVEHVNKVFGDWGSSLLDYMTRITLCWGNWYYALSPRDHLLFLKGFGYRRRPLKRRQQLWISKRYEWWQGGEDEKNMATPAL